MPSEYSPKSNWGSHDPCLAWLEPLQRQPTSLHSRSWSTAGPAPSNWPLSPWLPNRHRLLSVACPGPWMASMAAPAHRVVTACPWWTLISCGPMGLENLKSGFDQAYGRGPPRPREKNAQSPDLAREVSERGQGSGEATLGFLHTKGEQQDPWELSSPSLTPPHGSRCCTVSHGRSPQPLGLGPVTPEKSVSLIFEESFPAEAGGCSRPALWGLLLFEVLNQPGWRKVSRKVHTWVLLKNGRSHNTW